MLGYVHAMIHVGLSLEFKQPALLAEGLAQAAVHHDMWYTEYLTEAEAEAKKAAETSLTLAVQKMRSGQVAASNTSDSIVQSPANHVWTSKWQEMVS
jgi:hypothetical protein